MKKFISSLSVFNFKVGTLIVLIASASVIGVLAPRLVSVTKALDCADLTRIPSVATFNPFGVTWGNDGGSNCLDFATLSVKESNSSVYQPSLSAQNNDQLLVSAWVHNGARQDLGDEDLAKNIQAAFSVDTNPGSSHTVTVTLTGQDINGNQMTPKTGTITINTDPNSHIEVVPGSGEIRDHNFNFQSGASVGTNNFTVFLGDQRACFDFARFVNFTVKVVAGQSQNLHHDLSASLGSKIDGQCVWNGSITWHTSGYGSVILKVLDPDTNQEKVVAAEASHDGLGVNWIAQGKNFVFNLYGDGQLLETANIDGRTLPACNVQPSGDYSVSVNTTNFCVYSNGSQQNDIPTYKVIADAGLAGQQILWTSYKSSSSDPATIKNSPTGEIDANYGFVVGSNGVWQASGNAWTTADIGFWIKSANINGKRHDTQVFQVKDCTAAPATPTASLNVSLGSKLSGQCVWNGVITWSTTNVQRPTVYVIDPITQQAKVFSQQDNSSNPPQDAPWINPGYIYHIQLRGGNIQTIDRTIDATGLSANSCQTTPAQLTCSVSPTNVNVNQTVVFTASGGTPRYTFSTPGATNPNANSNSVTTSYASPGTYSGTVSDTTGAQVSCGTVVVAQNQCIANSNYAINGSAPVRNGSTYSTNITWSSTGSNNIRITQRNPGSTSDNTITTGGPSNNIGFTVNGLLPGNTYTFNMYDAACGGFLTSTQVITPPNPGQLVCSANNAVINSGGSVTFSVTSGGISPFNWQTPDGNPASGSGTSISPTYTNSGSVAVTKIATVTGSDGQSTTCSVSVNPAATAQGSLIIDKQVNDITTNTGYSHTNTVKNGDTVQYRIRVSAGSSVTLNNVRVTDSFASGLRFIDGSLLVNGVPHASGLTGGGLTFPTLSQTFLEITYQAQVTGTTGTITNTAQVSADNSSNSPQDHAVLSVVVVQSGQPTLTINKQVSNITQGTGYSFSVNAVKNDNVRYQVIVRNIGTSVANSVFVSDSNPAGVQPLRNLTVSKSYTGDIVSGVSLGNLDAGASVTLTYDGTVNVTSGNITNNVAVSAGNAPTQNASANVNVSTQNGGGNNTNNIFNTCVNYSCNTINTNTNTYYYINSSGSTVAANNFSQLGITKRVRLQSSGAFQKNVSANNNDTVEFEIVITNTGNQAVNNVTLSDASTGSLNFQNGTLRVDGNNNYSGSLFNGSLSLGSLFSGQQRRVTFQAQVNASAGASIQNIAGASGDNVSQVQDDAWVFVNSGSVSGSSVNLSFSKRANNDTKNADATAVPASKEDFITYTLTATNNGSAPATNFVITDDLSQVLPYADMVDNGGGSVSGNVISYPGLTVPAFGSVAKSFKVRVKFFLADNLSYVMSNTYGNTITIRINNPQVKGAFIAPKTGAETGVFTFASLMTAAFGVVRKRKYFFKILSI